MSINIPFKSKCKGYQNIDRKGGVKWARGCGRSTAEDAPPPPAGNKRKTRTIKILHFAGPKSERKTEGKK